MALKTKPFDSAAYLRTPEAVTAYLELALKDSDPERVEHAWAVAARAQALHGFHMTDETARSSAEDSGVIEKRPISTIRPDEVETMANILDRVRNSPGWADRKDGLVLKDSNGREVELVRYEGEREAVIVIFPPQPMV